MSHIKPLSETPESVTLSRADVDAMLEELEDAEDRMAVLEDCLLDREPEQNRYLLSMADTMRILDGASPITVWREKRGLTLTELADAVGLLGSDLATIESGGVVDALVAGNIAVPLEVLSDLGSGKDSVVSGQGPTVWSFRATLPRRNRGLFETQETGASERAYVSRGLVLFTSGRCSGAEAEDKVGPFPACRAYPWRRRGAAPPRTHVRSRARHLPPAAALSA
jgi:hypothetical protein